MRRVGLIGDPVGHSRSPAMHNAAFAALGIEVRYELWPTPLAELAARVASLRAGDVLGANVTVPHKAAVVPLLDEVSAIAARAGAVNTVVTRGGKLTGENTDVEGFARAVREASGAVTPAEAVVLGAGGAARAVLVALDALGVGRVTVVNRSDDKARALVAALASPAVTAQPWEQVAAAVEGASCLVNATSLGWQAGETPLAPALLDRLAPGALVVDLTYRQTDLLLAAAARSLRCLDGLPMLLYQGAAAFSLWTGQAAPIDVMRAALEEGIGERG